MRIALAQLDFLVGDLAGNAARVKRCVDEARGHRADIVLFPELALAGYPPEDLLLRPGFLRQAHEVLDALVPELHGPDVVLGHPWEQEGRRHNAVSWIRDGRVLGRYFKRCLPNYLVFDERRYFEAGSEPLVIERDGRQVGVIICEDAWEPGPARMAREAGAELLLVPNASPYREDKQSAREGMFAARHAETGLPMVYCNLVGGQDDLVFDGRSMLMNAAGELQGPGPLAEEALLVADWQPKEGTLHAAGWAAPPASHIEEIYRVLQRGLADYVRKNGFTDVVLGLSGGIDSALTVALAVDALGAQHVHTVMMPSRHTSELSVELAVRQAEQLGVSHRVISIEPAYEALLNALEPAFEGCAPDITEENLQARARGDILMALSNKFGWLPLATSNKSEMAVGYCTIYGDMCGGFAPIKDCLKTRVYELARWRNSQGEVIPREVILRAPSAELAPDQTDQDTLPPYEVLDEILRRYVEHDESVRQIIQAGFDPDVTHRVARLVLVNEYKRRQGPPGTRITARAFGRDRRYPITSGWKEN